MTRDADPWVRIEAIQAVATSDDVRVVPALVAALGDADSYVRQWAATELADMGNPQGARVLVDAQTADPALNATLVVGALEELTGLSFGKAEMPFVHSFEEKVDEAIAANRRLARRWMEWWKTEGARRYGD